MKEWLKKTGGNFFLLVLALILVAVGIFIGPALLVWGLGAIIQGEGFDLNFWSWLGGAAVLIAIGGVSRN